MKIDPETHQRDDRIALAKRRNLEAVAGEDERDAEARRAQVQARTKGPRYADRWPPQAIVSLRTNVNVIGRVKAVSDRHGRNTLVRVLESNDPRIVVGSEPWANFDWVLGRGRYTKRCEHCGYEFRNDHGGHRLCPMCDDSAEPELFEPLTTTTAAPAPKRPWDLDTPF